MITENKIGQKQFICNIMQADIYKLPELETDLI